MVEGIRRYKHIDLASVEPPGRQTDITYHALKEGVREIFVSDIDGNGTPVVVVLPHRIQATFICKNCMKAVTPKFYTEDAIRGHITLSRTCECGGMMMRKFLGAERDVPIEIDHDLRNLGGLESYIK